MRGNALCGVFMGKSRLGVLAVFGNVKVPRLFCPRCQALALVVAGHFQCCGDPTVKRPRKWKRESEASTYRKRPPPVAREAQLIAQDHRCLYCDGRFGSEVLYCRRLVVLEVHWDHVMPFSFSRDNSTVNFVAACQICNRIKHDKCFQTLEEARAHVASQREIKERAAANAAAVCGMF